MSQPQYGYDSPKTFIALGVFLFCWSMFAKPWPRLPVGRTAAALLGGCLMVTFQILTPLEAFASISGGTMLLLIGLMIILAKLEKMGVTHPLKNFLLWGNPTPRALLVRVSLTSAFLGSLIMNDGAAIFLTTIVMDIVEENDLQLEPFALAVATSANIGSASTVLGNPKNMLVQEKMPGLDFLSFARRMAPVAFLSTLVNTLFLYVYYWSDLDNIPLTRLKAVSGTSIARRTIIDDEDEDDADVLAMQQEYLASKLDQDFDDDLPPLGYVQPPPKESTPLKDDAPAYCPKFTETPKGYWAGSVSSRAGGTNYNAVSPGENIISDRRSSVRSIMSPAQSFSDCDPLDVAVMPRYHWPTKNNRLRPTSFLDNNSVNLSPLPLVSEAESVFGRPPAHLSFDENPLEPSYVQKPSLLSQWSGLVRPVLTGITLIVMYIGFIYKWDLGWTCLTAAMVVVFIDGQDASSIISDHINWSLMCYLFGIFSLLAGVSKTPLPRGVWQQFAPLINPKTPNLPLTTASFCSLIVLLSFILTSFPTVLLVAPYIPDLADPVFSQSAWFLLAWSVTLSGNLAPFGSVAGLIVSEICKDYCDNETDIESSKRASYAPVRSRRRRPNRWVGEMSVWMRYTSWSTVIFIFLGSYFIVFT